jgi:hypothetical protein
MLKCKNTFWIENMTDLFCDFRLIPFKNMDLESQMNALTRLVFFIFVILLLFTDVKNSLIFLIITLTIIIIFYYIKKKDKMDKYQEMFTTTNNDSKSKKTNSKSKYLIPYKRANLIPNPITGNEELIIDRPSNFTYVDDEVPFIYNQDYKTQKEYTSINQKLAGPPNPKTLIPPVIVPPIADLDYWKTNNLINHSRVNAESQIDNYQSGYQVSTCCGVNENNMYLEDNSPKLISSYNNTKKNKSNYKKSNYKKNVSNVHEYLETKENFEKQRHIKNNIKEDDSSLKMPYEIKPNESGQVNITCGYNPEQLFEAGLPTNLPAGECEKNPIFKQYNTNVFTETIQPGVYTRTEVNEPINSNIGISFNQQFEPVSTELDENGLTFISHDPRLYTEPIEPYLETVNESNVYDPRFSGYGTSYRAYTDDKIGQTRFYYDDIDSVRMPNYITRSNIDFMKAADTYGPMLTEEGNPYNSQIRNLANNQFLQSSMEFRTGMQERLMRKRNAEGWQQRVMPLNTNVARYSGGTRNK